MIMNKKSLAGNCPTPHKVLFSLADMMVTQLLVKSAVNRIISLRDSLCITLHEYG